MLQRKRKLPKGVEINSSAHVANVELHPSTIIDENKTKKNEKMQCYKGHQNTCLHLQVLAGNVVMGLQNTRTPLTFSKYHWRSTVFKSEK